VPRRRAAAASFCTFSGPAFDFCLGGFEAGGDGSGGGALPALFLAPLLLVVGICSVGARGVFGG